YSLQALEAVGEKIPAVKPGRHSNCDDDACRLAGEQPRPWPRVLARDGKARPEHLLEKALQHRRHGAEPERVDDHQVVGPADSLLALTDRRRRLEIIA